jgi:uncharacterized protein YaiL (DUF2058 family)
MPEDSATLAAIDRVGRDVRELRTDLTQQMAQMITRNEHDAEVRRIDAEAQHTRAALVAHETEADKRLTAIQADIEEGERKRTAAQEAAAERRRQDRRFMVGTVITGMAAASAVVGLVVAIFGG